MFNFLRKRRIRSIQNKLLDQVLSSEAVDAQVIAGIHLTRLQVEKSPEIRIRSIQTLLDLQHPAGVAAGINELVIQSADWTRPGATERIGFLLDALRKCDLELILHGSKIAARASSE